MCRWREEEEKTLSLSFSPVAILLKENRCEYFSPFFAYERCFMGKKPGCTFCTPPSLTLFPISSSLREFLHLPPNPSFPAVKIISRPTFLLLLQLSPRNGNKEVGGEGQDSYFPYIFLCVYKRRAGVRVTMLGLISAPSLFSCVRQHPVCFSSLSLSFPRQMHLIFFPFLKIYSNVIEGEPICSSS